MSYSIFKPVIVIPADKLKQINDFLERNGYGPDNFSMPVFAKSEIDNKAPTTNYILECTADTGFLSAIEKAIDKIVTANITVYTREIKQSQIDTVLSSLNLKKKPVAVSVNVDEEPLGV